MSISLKLLRWNRRSEPSSAISTRYLVPLTRCPDQAIRKDAFNSKAVPSVNRYLRASRIREVFSSEFPWVEIIAGAVALALVARIVVMAYWSVCFCLADL